MIRVIPSHSPSMQFDKKDLLFLAITVFLAVAGIMVDDLLMVSICLLLAGLVASWGVCQHIIKLRYKIFMCIAIWVIAIGIFWRISYVREEKDLLSRTGLLKPASDKAPTNGCVTQIEDGIKRFKSAGMQGAIASLNSRLFDVRKAPYFAWGGLTVSMINQTFDLITIKNRPLVTLSTDKNDRIYITTRIFDKNNNVIVKIDNNQLTIIDHNISDWKRPDKSTLIIYDNQDNEIFRLRYNNPNSMSVSGTMYFDGIPLTVDGDTVKFGGVTMSGGTCLSGRSGIVIN